MHGYATSSFAFKAEQLVGDLVIATTTFADIPTTPNTIVNISSNGDISSLTPLVIDQNGDGIPEYALSAIQNGTVTIPRGGIPPELKLMFSTSTLRLAAYGIDTNSTDVLFSTSSISAKDSEGNSVVLGLSGYKEKNGRIRTNLTKLGYNGAASSIATSTIKYKWATDRAGNISMFAAFLQTASTTLEVHYRPKKNQTIIMQYPTDIDDSDIDDSCDVRPVRVRAGGLIIPWVETQNGKIVVKYAQ
jgi:hypothetical protein